MEWVGPVVTGVGGIVAGIVGGYFLVRKTRVEAKTKETEVEATATSAFLEGQKAFQAYVNGVVVERVEAAVADLQRQVTELEAEMAGMRKESHEMNDAIRARETQLWLWNIRNRPGPMPELPEPILHKLGITHLSSFGDLEDTQPTRPMPEPPTTT